MQKSLDLGMDPSGNPAQIPYDMPDRKKWNGLVLVGEAPGAEEVKLGHPFVGRSGKLLNDVLEKAAIERPNCLIANVFRFQPPKNKVDHFFTSKRAAVQENRGIATEYGQFGSAWCREEFASEIKALGEMLAEWKPKVVVALGRTPFWALTGENGLLANVGSFFPCRLAANMQVLPTFHPSFILRGNWAKQPEWLAHFLAAQQQASVKSATK